MQTKILEAVAVNVLMLSFNHKLKENNNEENIVCSVGEVTEEEEISAPTMIHSRWKKKINLYFKT